MGNKIKFYTDEHIPKAVVKGLRQRGADVLTVAEVGMLGASDEAHLRKAQGEGRVIFTQDDDLLRLAATGAEHSGIVYTPQHASIGEVIYGLMLIYQVMESEDMENHVEYI